MHIHLCGEQLRMGGGGATPPAWALALACTLLGVLSLVLLRQLWSLANFYRRHVRTYWMASERPRGSSEVDDPLLAVGGRLCLLRPRAREKGVFLMPPGSAAEPQRTEDELTRAFHGCSFHGCSRLLCCGRRALSSHRARAARRRPIDEAAARAGRELEHLQVWLGDSSATCAGVASQFMHVATQLALAINTGALLALDSSVQGRSVQGQQVQLGVNVALLAFAAAYSAAGTANDIWIGVTVAACYALECAANACLLASTWPPELAASLEGNGSTSTTTSLAMTSLASGGGGGGGGDEGWRASHEAHVARALQLAVAAAGLLQAAVFLPLAMMVYDSVICPIALKVWSEDPGTPVEVVCSVLVAAHRRSCCHCRRLSRCSAPRSSPT